MSVICASQLPRCIREWVTDRYLQLPPDFSERIQELANSITAGKVTPYDKTVAITQYLRDTIILFHHHPAPPPGRDVMEWFLFELKSGFCNYYATAEVLMLRSLGIPARIIDRVCRRHLYHRIVRVLRRRAGLPCLARGVFSQYRMGGF